ncbi:radical SAM protein [Chloroflexota bacterium]
MTQVGKGTRNHIFHGITRSLCPECRALVDAQILIREGKVYLRKHCPEHEWHEALISSDADWYLKSAPYNKPGSVPLKLATSVENGCPYDCGLCPEHQQHTCLGLIEITTRCNLACPTCFADAGEGYDLTLSQVETILDRFVETEGSPEVVQISGGEPTIHPQVVDIVAAAWARNISHVMLNTNGIRLAQEPDFVRQLAEYDPTIYLQFDGLDDATYRLLRGCDLLDTKKRALDNLAEAGLYANLVATVVKGVNDGQLGDIVRFALEHPAVLGICYQPVTFSGRHDNRLDPMDRVTVADVLSLLEAQTSGLFKASDFRPVPCPHPDCSACTYAWVDGDEVTPITRLLNVDDYLDYAVNRTVVDLSSELRPVLEALWSMSSVLGGENAASALSCAACGVDLTALDPKNLNEGFFMIQVHAFMDEHNFDLKRLMKCCVHQLLPDGRAVPLCAYNNLGYREQVEREQEAVSGR